MSLGEPLRPFARARRYPSLLIGGALLVVGVVVLIGGTRHAVREGTYQRRGEVVRAVVLAKEMRPATQNRGTSFAVRYRFIASDGALVEGRQPVDAERWEALREGGPIEIQHVAGNPALQRLAGQSERSEALTLFVVGGVLTGVGVCLFARGLRRGRRDWRILRDGVPAEGTVSGVARTAVHVNGRPVLVVRYRYQDHLGRLHEGSSPYVSSEEAETWHAGDKARIRFDRERPAESVWLGREASR